MLFDISKFITIKFYQLLQKKITRASEFSLSNFIKSDTHLQKKKTPRYQAGKSYFMPFIEDILFQKNIIVQKNYDLQLQFYCAKSIVTIR